MEQDLFRHTVGNRKAAERQMEVKVRLWYIYLNSGTTRIIVFESVSVAPVNDPLVSYYLSNQISAVSFHYSISLTACNVYSSYSLLSRSLFFQFKNKILFLENNCLTKGHPSPPHFQGSTWQWSKSIPVQHKGQNGWTGCLCSHLASKYIYILIQCVYYD